MTVTHPVAERDGNGHPSGYTYGGVTYHIDGDGVIDCPPDVEAEIREALADHYDVDTDGDDAEVFTCAGNDGECSREVDEPGGRCWQHDDED